MYKAIRKILFLSIIQKGLLKVLFLLPNKPSIIDIFPPQVIKQLCLNGSNSVRGDA